MYIQHVGAQQYWYSIPDITFLKYDLSKAVSNYKNRLITNTHLVTYCNARVHKLSKSHLKIQGARRVTRSKFHTEEQQILGTIIQNLVTIMT
jgi:hypothetical protein